MAITAALLAGCGGGGGGSTPPVSSGGKQTASVKMNFSVPVKSGSALRGRKYISFNTAGLGITVVATGGATPLPSTVAQMRTPTWGTTIAPGFNAGNTQQGANCTSAGGGSSYSCTIILTMPVGYDDIQITTWDQPPTGQGYGATFPTGNNLSFQNITNQLVEINTNNVFNYTMSGIVSSVAVEVSPNSLITGGATGGSVNPLTPTVNVLAVDAAGNTIIGSDPLVDQNGNPVSVQITASPTYPISPSPSPAGSDAVFHLNNASTPAVNDSCPALAANGGMTNPSLGSCVLTYDGGDVQALTIAATAVSSPAQTTTAAAAITSTGSQSVTPASMAGIVVGSSLIYDTAGTPETVVVTAVTSTTFTATFTLTHGAAATITVPSALINAGAVGFTRTANGGVGIPGAPAVTEYTSGLGGTGAPYLAALGPDGNVWFSDQGVGIGKETTAGAATTYAAPTNGGVVTGPDQNVWFADSNNAVGVFSPTSSTYVEVALASPTTSVVVGPDNKMWATETNGDLAQLDWVGGVPTFANEYTPGFAGALTSLTSGPNGHLWGVDPTNVYEIDPSNGSILSTYPVPSGTPSYITADANGNLWIDTFAPNQVMSMTPLGVFGAAYPLQGLPDQLTSGPDGNIWVAARFAGAGSQDEIARVDLATNSVQEYPAGITTCSGTSPHLTGIATGSDNNLWFMEWGCNRIGKLTP